MGQVSLKKLLAKGNLNETFAKLVELAGAPAALVDARGALLWGKSSQLEAPRAPVLVGEQTLGWVVGAKGAEALAEALGKMLEGQVANRAIAAETLDTYRELSLLYSLGENLATSLEWEELIDKVLAHVTKIVTCHAASLMLVHADTRSLMAVAGLGREAQDKLQLKPGEGIAGSVFATGRAEVVNDASQDPRFVKGPGQVGHLICIPLRQAGTPMGVLNLSRMTGEPFTARDLKLASALGFQASLALANSKHYTDLRRNLTGTIDSLVEAIEKLDQNQEGHSKRVAAHALAVGKGMKLPGAVLVRLKLAAMLHDIGKIGLPDNLPSHYQRTIIERHTRGGAEILKPIAHMKDILEGVMFHHENYDGTGLPFRLKGDKIPIMARVIAVADAYDRYTKGNQQGRRLRPVQALDRLKRDSGTRFDPHVVAVFLDTCVDLQDQGPAQASAADIFGPLVR